MTPEPSPASSSTAPRARLAAPRRISKRLRPTSRLPSASWKPRGLRLKNFTAPNPAEPAELVAVHAPTAGRVLKRFRESEGVVNAGESLLEVGSPRTLEVEIEVLSSDAVRLAPGTRVLFERWGGDQPLEGLVRTVEPFGFTKVSALGVEEQRVLVIADFTSPHEQWERLGDGYRVEAVFILWEGENVLQVPASALFRQGDGWAVFVIEEGKAARRKVEVGHRSGLTAEVVSGLNEGDRVDYSSRQRPQGRDGSHGARWGPVRCPSFGRHVCKAWRFSNVATILSN